MVRTAPTSKPAHYRRFEVSRVSRPYLDRLWSNESAYFVDVGSGGTRIQKFRIGFGYKNFESDSDTKISDRIWNINQLLENTGFQKAGCDAGYLFRVQKKCFNFFLLVHCPSSYSAVAKHCRLLWLSTLAHKILLLQDLRIHCHLHLLSNFCCLLPRCPTPQDIPTDEHSVRQVRQPYNAIHCFPGSSCCDRTTRQSSTVRFR